MRRTPSDRSIKILFAASGGLCAFPGCTTKLVQLQSLALLGELCHIHASSPGGPRFDPTQSDEARNDADNLIILCPTHHSLVDQDPNTYTAASLRNMKQKHESRVEALISPGTVELTDQQAVDFSRQIDDESVDFAIVVALQKELAAVRSYFPELVQVAPSSSSTRTYYRGAVPTKRGGLYRIVVTLLHSMGNLEAAHATSDLIREWNPRFVLVNGIAAGISRKDQNFGDIVVSNSVVYYELAKIRANDFERRSRHFQADPSLLDGILNLTSSVWRTRLPPRPDGTLAEALEPKIHIGPIASGEKVIATVEGVQGLLSIQRNLIAIEMESAGVASAAFSAVKKVGFLAIRAICDFADTAKDDSWQDYAAHSAASCLRDFVESHPIPLSEGRWPKAEAPVVMPKVRISTTQRRKLFDQLCAAFDIEEFKNLCFLLGVENDEIPGDRKSARVRELILLFERHDALDVLEEAVYENAANERGEGESHASKRRFNGSSGLILDSDLQGEVRPLTPMAEPGTRFGAQVSRAEPSLTIDTRARLLAVLADAPQLRTAALEVIESPKYPRMMHLGDRLIPNPVWRGPALAGTPDIRPISDRLRGHMLLAVAEPPGMNPHIYCYRSERWNAYLLPFFKHECEPPGAVSPNHALDAHVARRYSSRVVSTNKFVVSVKRNEEHPEEWWLYAFEFYSLVLPADFELSNSHRWLDLERLSDPRYREAAVNGDVIRAIRNHFGTGLHGLERSPVTTAGARFGDS